MSAPLAILQAAERLGVRLKKVGAREWAGPCPACGGIDRFAINTAKGVFNCRGCGCGGDEIALVRHVTGYSFHEALDFLGDDRLMGQFKSSPGRREPRLELPDGATTTTDALKIWRASVDPRLTPVEVYLAKRNLLLEDAVAGEAIRWHPGVGAMVALFREIETDEPQAISRTFLDQDGGKLGRKFLGPVGGAAVKLDPDGNVLGGLHIGEGVETCLAARQMGFRPAWALGSAGAIGRFPVLDGIEALTILAENDGANARAAAEVGERWSVARHEVLIVRSVEESDLNDALKRRATT
jgi:hypothetical protein